MLLWNLTTRINRAAAYRSSDGAVPPKPSTRQSQNGGPAGNMKRSISDENSSIPITCQNKRRTVLKDVTNVLIESSYRSCMYATKVKCGSVAETVAYDMALEVAMKIQHFQQRSLLLHDPWKWLLTVFAAYYGVSEVYTKLRYLSYIMDVATPTADCLILVHDLLLPVITKGHSKSTLSIKRTTF